MKKYEAIARKVLSEALVMPSWKRKILVSKFCKEMTDEVRGIELRNMELIIQRILEEMNWEMAYIVSTREHPWVLYKQIMIRICIEQTNANMRDVASRFGLKSHATVINCIKSIENEVFTNSEFGRTYLKLKEIVKNENNGVKTSQGIHDIIKRVNTCYN